VAEPPTVQVVKEMLDSAQHSPMGEHLAASGFDIDMSDPDQAQAVAMHVLHQIQVLDAITRILAGKVQAFEAQLTRSESLFV
jgi:hypothetical protein